MRVVFTDGMYKCRCTFETRNIPKDAGFRWDAINKFWFTSNHGVAARLSSYLDDNAKTEIAKHRLMIETWAGGLSVPQGERLLPFQEDACLFALSRNRSYLALDPGLGKTPVAAVIAKTLFDERPIGGVYICPPFLTRNTEFEFTKWAPRLQIKRFEPGKAFPSGFHFLIIPDSVIMREELQNEIKDFTMFMEDRQIETILFVDEAHRFKNDSALRTKSLFGTRRQKGIADNFNKIVYLSGTPMPNRPIELYPVLSHSASQTIHGMGQHEYALHFCNAFENQWGWDYSGASNVEQLASQVIGTFMLRMKKQDVLKDLPPKLEEMVIIGGELTPKLLRMTNDVLKAHSPEDLMKGIIKADLECSELHLSTYRKELGILKAKAAAEYVNYILEETEESVLVFAIHKEVISILTTELTKHFPLVITGETRMELRDAIVKEFQSSGNKRRVFIGNIQAAGTGLTLTKATRVVFAEFSWVPADNDQAADRAHRIGQDEKVLVQYLVHKNSIDRTVIETVLRKRKITALV